MKRSAPDNERRKSAGWAETQEPSPTGTQNTVSRRRMVGAAAAAAVVALEMSSQVVAQQQQQQQGMKPELDEPCPVCGDKVSGYHYGLLTCESCKVSPHVPAKASDVKVF